MKLLIYKPITLLLLVIALGWSQDTESQPAIDSAALAPVPSIQAVAVDTVVKPIEKPSEKLHEAYSLHPFTSILVLGFSLSYERFIKPGVSLDIPVFIGLADKLYEQGRFFIGTGFGMRYYLRHSQSGGYLSPTIQVLNTTFFEDKSDAINRPGGNVLTVMGGVRYGYKFLWPHFTIDAGLGLYGFQTLGGTFGSPRDEDVTILLPMGHFSLGIPF